MGFNSGFKGLMCNVWGDTKDQLTLNILQRRFTDLCIPYTIQLNGNNSVTSIIVFHPVNTKRILNVRR